MEPEEIFKEFTNMFWEPLSKGLKLECSSILANLPGKPSSISLERDEEYGMQGTIDGEATGSPSMDRDSRPGSIVPLFEIKGQELPIGSYNIEGCYLNDIRITQSGLTSRNPKALFSASLNYQRLTINSIPEVVPYRLIEWCLNGPSNNTILGRPSCYDFSQAIVVRRLDANSESHLKKPGSQIASDYYMIDATSLGFGFISFRVPGSLGPPWSDNIGVEYSEDYGRIPSEEEREGIRELLSFIIGKQLLLVGSTSFDKDDIITREMAINPWSKEARSICRRAALPPTHGNQTWAQKFEETVEELLPKYLALRDELALSDIIWRYWIGSRLPLGTDIPIMISAIETLGKKWLDSTRSKTKSIYIEKKEFKALTETEFQTIEGRLSGHPYKERIMRSLRDSYQMSGNERFELFFDEIELQLGELEKEALRYRNILIHNAYELSQMEINKLILLSKATTTLFNRTLLRVLQYGGNYRDFTVVGFPSKELAKPAGP